MMLGTFSTAFSPKSQGSALKASCVPRAARITPITPLMPVDAAHGDIEQVLKPLWLRAQDGDEGAYRQCLTLLSSRLRAYLRRRLTAQPDEVEDLVQETLLALHLQRGTYDPSLPVSAWAVAIARHKLIDAWRRRGRRDALHDAFEDVDEALLASEPSASPSTRTLAPSTFMLAVWPGTVSLNLKLQRDIDTSTRFFTPTATPWMLRSTVTPVRARLNTARSQPEPPSMMSFPAVSSSPRR